MGQSYGIGGRTTKKPAKGRAKLLVVLVWAWVELNYRPHAYQAGSPEHALRLEVLTGLHFTNILLSMSRI